jgi:hypothetical protein
MLEDEANLVIQGTDVTSAPIMKRMKELVAQDKEIAGDPTDLINSVEQYLKSATSEEDYKARLD